MNQHPTVEFPGLRWRPATAIDVPAWAALIARTAMVETPVWYEREADLQQQVESRKNPPAVNTVLGMDNDDVPRAYARISRNPGAEKAHGFGCVDPAWQRRGIGRALLVWLEERTRRRFAGNPSGGAAQAPLLRIHTEQQHHHQARLLDSSGYTVVRYFNEMHRPLASRCRQASLPAAWNWPPWRLASTRQSAWPTTKLSATIGEASHGMRSPGTSR